MKPCIKSILVCIALLGLLGLSACSVPKKENQLKSPTPSYTPLPSPLSDIVYDADTPEQMLEEGKQVFQNSCGRCHKLPVVRQIKAFPSDGAMVVGTLQMAELAKVPQEDLEKLIRYLLALRHDRSP
ncbi:MAG: hypothetical protein HYX82_00440 [Chloroflexi bacterium]|nr:hypothetical protein [Chloroflexota bacterium]